MTRRFQENGTVVPVTLVKVGPCTVTQVKNSKRDGYEAVQIGFETKKKISQPLKGHLKDLDSFRYLREFRVSSAGQFKRGDLLDVSIFQEGDVVQVSGISKGKGFQGVVKRHGFHGSPATHGHKDQLRMPGSIGSAFPEHVLKGRRMAGRMGGKRATAKNLEIIEVNQKDHQLAIKGAVPGARNQLILILGEGEVSAVIPENNQTPDKVSPKNDKEQKEDILKKGSEKEEEKPNQNSAKEDKKTEGENK